MPLSVHSPALSPASLEHSTGFGHKTQLLVLVSKKAELAIETEKNKHLNMIDIISVLS